MKPTHTIILVLLSLILTGCSRPQITTNREPQNVQPISTPENNQNNIIVEDKDTISFPGNKMIGVETGEIEKVFIQDTISNKKMYLNKPEVLKNRWISNLQKIDNNTFSFIITASPHFAQYFEYNLQGESIVAHPIADECYMLESFPRELQDKAKIKCQTNPEFGTLEELSEKLKKIKMIKAIGKGKSTTYIAN